MLASREARDEMSFRGALDDQKLPILLQVLHNVILNNKTVFEKDQYITILDRSFTCLLSGVDWNSKPFILSKDMVQEYQVNIVEEYQPTSIQELRTIIEKCTHIQLKIHYKDDNYDFNCFETFKFCEFLDDSYQNVVLKSSQERVCLDTKILMDPNVFALAKVKEVMSVKEFVKSFRPDNPTLLCFRDRTSGIPLPLGNVTIESVGKYEMAHAVTLVNKGRDLKYETFPVDKRVKFGRVREKIPKHVEVFGAFNSNAYREKLKEIKMLMNYDFHSPRFYANLVVENHCYVPPIKGRQPVSTTTFQRPTQINLQQGEKTTVRDSIRRGFNKILRPSPSKEDLHKQMKTSSLHRGLTNKYSDPVTTGFYKPLNKDHGLLNEIVKTNDQEKVENVEHPTLAPRSSSDPSNKDTLVKQENPLYGLDTITIEKLKKQLQEENPKSPSKIQSKVLSPNDLERKKRTKPARPKSFDLDNKLFFRMDLSDEIYERPFDAKSPLGRPKHISNDNISRPYTRSPSMPVRRIPPRPEYGSSHSVSPPRPRHIFADRGFDSGVDSPEETKSSEQLASNFQERGRKESDTRQRSQSALDKRRSLEGSDLDISWPFNFKHISKRADDDETEDSIYSIPKKRLDDLASFEQLDQSMSFPDLKKMEMVRCRSEPFLNKFHVATSPAPIYEDIIYGDVKGKSTSDIDLMQKRELQSIREIKTYSIPQVVELLKLIKLDKHISTFERNLVNGELLLNLTVESICDVLKLTKFQARKLHKYVHGWRPNFNHPYSSELTKVERMDRNEWTVTDVVEQMKAINLPQFSQFCYENLIDGALLLDLTHCQVLPTEEDGMALNSVESERLRSYVTKELSYDEADQSFLGKN